MSEKKATDVQKGSDPFCIIFDLVDTLHLTFFFACAEKFHFPGRKNFFSGQEKKFLSFGAYFASSVKCQLK